MNKESLYHKDEEGNNVVNKLLKNKILVGVKVDEGLLPVYNKNKLEEYITNGLLNLHNKCFEYKKLGIKFVKWRCVFRIHDDILPSNLLIDKNLKDLCKFSSICHEYDIVPMIEPEILMDGNHSIYKTLNIQKKIFKDLFILLKKYKINLNYIIIKTNMVCPGIENKNKINEDDIGNLTVKLLKESIPSKVKLIAFLSGGLSEEDCSSFLHNIKKKIKKKRKITFSFGRGLQNSCLKLWKGENKNTKISQKKLLERLIENTKEF